MRKKLIAANWKMHKTPEEATAFVREFGALVSNYEGDEVAIFTPFISLSATLDAVRDSHIAVGAQNMHWEDDGAFTGEISATMLIAIGCQHVIIGHSERRHYFGENDTDVNRKLRCALQHKLKAIVCIGESLQQRKSGLMQRVLSQQIAKMLDQISSSDVDNFCLAYEPVWAIGTGDTATPEMTAEAHAFIRCEVAKALGEPAATRLKILYGGSVKPDNASALMSTEEIDGALVGSASLDPNSFAAIVKWRPVGVTSLPAGVEVR
jgi:triosephosphate isomerase